MIRSPILFILGIAFSAQDPRAAWQERLEKYSASADAWKQRKAEIRQQILVAAGLWPEFERAPLKPAVFGKVEGEGYAVERVRVETWPGFHLSGSLYRPLGKTGPFPGVVSPHGHWGEGRFTQTKDGNLPARGITLARLGFVCFMYDMVGYADFKQIPHRGKLEEPAWGIGSLGIQLWNSLRAVDFLTSLPDVDPKRIGCTGASGGGTQTFLLTAVDDRIACSVQVNMVAAEFQGGCSCENAPFLRIDLNNVEIAAATAPRPLMLVSATGDWTKNVPTLEGPAIQRAYKALGIEERFKWVQFQAPHNYNKDSREAVYAWLVRWLRNGPAEDRVPEPDVPPVKREELTVYPDGKLPEGAVDAEGLKRFLREKIQAQLDGLRPRDGASLQKFRDVMTPALRQTLTVKWPAGAFQVQALPAEDGAGLEGLFLSHKELPRRLEISQTPRDKAGRRQANIVVVSDAAHDTLVQALAKRDDLTVVLHAKTAVDEPPSGGNDAQRKSFPTTFYRTALAKRVQDVLAVLAYVASRPDVTTIRLIGLGDEGIPTLLARPLAAPAARVNLTIADLAGTDDSEHTWTGARAHPGMMRIGGLRTAAMIAPPGMLVLHNLQGRFDPSRALEAFHAAGRDGAATVSETGWSEEKIIEALK